MFESLTGPLNRADGSATVISNGTKVLVAVSGPIEPKSRQELPTTAALEVTVLADIGASNTREKLLEDKLRAILSQVVIGSLYPRQLIQITVQILEAGEDKEYTVKELSTIINATYLALIDANIALNSSFASATLAVDSKRKIIVNPTKQELRKAQSVHVVAFQIQDAHSNSLLYSDSIGDFTENEILNVILQGKKETDTIHQKFRKTIQSKIETDLIWQL